jgi:GNAT superfamily N-acetyltransferase
VRLGSHDLQSEARVALSVSGGSIRVGAVFDGLLLPQPTATRMTRRTAHMAGSYTLRLTGPLLAIAAGVVERRRVDRGMLAPMAGRVRPATAEDTRAIAEVQVRGWRWAYRELLPEAYLATMEIDGREQMWRRWLAADAPVRLLVWNEGDRIRGFAAYGQARDDEPDARGAGWLHALYIDEELVGRGVGRALHDAALDGMRAAGHDAALLWVLEDNARALAFYARQGWAPDEHRKRCAFGDEHRFELRLAYRL